MVVSRSALRNFVRRAIRRLPDEYIGTMWGRRARGAKQLLICDIQPVDHEATPANITDWDENDLVSGETLGPLVCWGSIHSHPLHSDSSPSEEDWEFFAQQKEMLSAICYITRGGWRHSTRTRFYFSQALVKMQYGP